MVCQPLLWLPAKLEPKLVLCFITYCKIVCTSRSIFIDDSLYQKLLILVQLCWRYLKISQVSGFFETQCILRTGWSIDRPTDRPTNLTFGEISNGHRGRPIHFMFGSTVGFSGSALGRSNGANSGLTKFERRRRRRRRQKQCARSN